MSIEVPTAAQHEALIARVAALEARPIGGGAGITARYLKSGPEVDMAVPVMQYPQAQWRNVYVLNLGALAAGDLVFVTIASEVRNDAGFNVEFATQTLIAPGGLYYHDDMGNCPTANPPWYSGAHLLSPINGTNVDPTKHYLQHNRTEVWRCPANMPSAIAYHRVRCRSTAATGAEMCTIMQGGYGEMEATILTGVT